MEMTLSNELIELADMLSDYETLSTEEEQPTVDKTLATDRKKEKSAWIMAYHKSSAWLHKKRAKPSAARTETE